MVLIKLNIKLILLKRQQVNNRIKCLYLYSYCHKYS